MPGRFTRSFGVALFLLIFQVCFAQDSSKVVPETALLSFERYTNQFFAFSLPLPPNQNLRIAELSRAGMWRPLFGLGEESSHTAFVISALQMTSEEASRIRSTFPAITIQGREFAKGLSQPKKHDNGGLWGAIYLTTIDNYLLKFEIRSLDPHVTEDLERCVEQIQFFEPGKAREIAGPKGKPYPPTTQGQAKH